MSTERFNDKLIALLKRNPDFRDETGELLRDRVKNSAWISTMTSSTYCLKMKR